MNSHRLEHLIPKPAAFVIGEKLRIADDLHLRALATSCPVTIAQWVKTIIESIPASILENPPMVPLLARHNIASFAVASVDTDFIHMTEGPDEVHITMAFTLQEQPSSEGSTPRSICGRVNVICKRQQALLFDVQAAEVRSLAENKQ